MFRMKRSRAFRRRGWAFGIAPNASCGWPIRAAGRCIGWGLREAGQDAGPGTDFHAVANNYVSVTPLQIDLTRHAMLDDVQSWLQGREA